MNSPAAESKKVSNALADLLRDHDPTIEDPEDFRGHQYDHGLAWVHFPEGHGGLGVRPQLQREAEAALRNAGAKPPHPATFFLNLAGPTIVTHGSDEQKNRFLRPIFTGEDRWCQLFSEPGAGSDFAGLGTSAVKDVVEWRSGLVALALMISLVSSGVYLRAASRVVGGSVGVDMSGIMNSPAALKTW